MHSILKSIRAMLTNIFGYFKKRNVFNSQEISQEKFIRLNEIALEEKSKSKTN